MTNERIKEAAVTYPGMILKPYDEIFGKLGFEPLSVFAERFGGCQVYVPRIRHIFKDCLAKALINEFDGANYADLAVKYGFCEKNVRDIVKSYKKKQRADISKNRIK